MLNHISLTNICRTSVLVSRTENKYSLNVPSQFIELRPFYGAKGNSGIESLLEDVTDNQIDDAINLVNGKVIYQIYGEFYDIFFTIKLDSIIFKVYY